jgi:hypothetical protein
MPRFRLQHQRSPRIMLQGSMWLSSPLRHIAAFEKSSFWHAPRRPRVRRYALSSWSEESDRGLSRGLLLARRVGLEAFGSGGKSSDDPGSFLVKKINVSRARRLLRRLSPSSRGGMLAPLRHWIVRVATDNYRLWRVAGCRSTSRNSDAPSRRPSEASSQRNVVDLVAA